MVQVVFDTLFTYVRKNTVLKSKIQNMHLKKDKCSQLEMAIQQANFKDKIFSDENCLYLVLALMEKEKIEYWQGITFYIYVLMLSYIPFFLQHYEIQDEQFLQKIWDKLLKEKKYEIIFEILSKIDMNGASRDYLWQRCQSFEVQTNPSSDLEALINSSIHN